jgi:hypothetical protein
VSLAPTCYACGPTSFVETANALLVASTTALTRSGRSASARQEIEDEFLYDLPPGEALWSPSATIQQVPMDMKDLTYSCPESSSGCSSLAVGPSNTSNESMHSYDSSFTP